MSWTCPGHYKVHVYGRDSPGRPVHGHCPVPLPALPCPTSAANNRAVVVVIGTSASSSDSFSADDDGIVVVIFTTTVNNAEVIVANF